MITTFFSLSSGIFVPCDYARTTVKTLCTGTSQSNTIHALTLKYVLLIHRIMCSSLQLLLNYVTG